MRCWILAAVAAFVQADTAETFYRFPKGTAWTYKQSLGDTAFRVVLTVVEEAEGRIAVESKEYLTEGKDPVVKTLAWALEDGFLVWGEVRSGKILSPLRVYKPGSKKGDTWKSPLTGGRGELEAIHLGTSEVKVPAGTYRDAVRVAFRYGADQEKPLMEIALVPRVGMVRFGGTAGGAQALMELSEFREAK
jgi:hypothetical protein